MKYFALILLAGLLSCKSKTTSTATTEFPDQPYLKGAAAQWDQSFNSRNLNSLMALYSEDVVYMPPTGPTIHGLQNLKATLSQFYAGHAKVQHQTFVDEIQAKDNWALERSRYRLTYVPAATGEQYIETGRHVIFRKKLGDRWYIVWEMWNLEQ